MAGNNSKRNHANTAKRKVRPWEWVVILGALVLGGWIVLQMQGGKSADAAFSALAQSGQAALSRVETGQDAGGGHVAPGQSVAYPDRFPTSGRHDPVSANPGVYDEVQPPTKLVHAIEHGMIVIYYDAPTPEVFATLTEWAALYGDPWSGIVVTPAPGIGPEIVLTAWNRTLRLNPFEPAAAAAFIDRYRGRGPEHPVR